MAHILFWEKPGCAGNARQRAMLRAAGHSLEVLDLLRWPWSAEELLAFLAPLPVAQWFNRAAPKIKRGLVHPESLDSETALQLLLEDPLLIRRPLMQSDEVRRVGFDARSVHAWIGLGPQRPPPDTPLEGCAANHRAPKAARVTNSKPGADAATRHGTSGGCEAASTPR